MPPKKSTRGKTSVSDLQKHLDNVKKDLKELTSKIGKANRSELSKLSYEASKTVGDTASDIIKNSSVLLEKASKVLHGAIEGGKKAAAKSTTAKKKTARKPAAKKSAPKRKTTTARKTTAKKTTTRRKTTAAKKTSTSATAKRKPAAKKTTTRSTARKTTTARKRTAKK